MKIFVWYITGTSICKRIEIPVGQEIDHLCESSPLLYRGRAGAGAEAEVGAVPGAVRGGAGKVRVAAFPASS